MDNSISKGLTLTQEETKLRDLEEDYSKFKKDIEVMFGKTSSKNLSMQQQLHAIQTNVNRLSKNTTSTPNNVLNRQTFNKNKKSFQNYPNQNSFQDYQLSTPQNAYFPSKPQAIPYKPFDSLQRN